MTKATFSNRPPLEAITAEKINAAIEEIKQLREQPTKLFCRHDAWRELEQRIDMAAHIMAIPMLRVYLVDELPRPWMTDLELGRELAEALARKYRPL